MKSGIAYLTITKLKNSIKNVIKSPVKIIYFIIIIALMAFVLLTGNASSGSFGDARRSIEELGAIALALYTFIFVMQVNSGFSNGGSMFTMSDVNMLFVSPVRPQRVLFYGLMQQMWSSLLLGLFILFQYSWLHSMYGVNYVQLIVLILGYAITVFLGQLTAMVLYSATSADDGKKRTAKTIFFAIVIAFAAYVGINALTSPDGILNGAVAACGSIVMKLLPVSGWAACAVMGILTGSIFEIVLGIGLSILYFAALVAVIVFVEQDYYEDVIKSAEITRSAINAQKEGTMAEAAPKNIKLGKTGIEKGSGASVFYYKHCIENRRSKVFIFSTSTIIFAATTIFIAFFMKNAGIFVIFAFATYMQMFSVALGRFNRELTKPFIYLMPEPPLKKMAWALMEELPSAALEAVLVFVPIGVITLMTPVEILFCVLARVSFTFLFIAGNVVVERLWGGSASKTIVMMLYFVVLIVMAVPGVVLAVVFSAVMNLSVGASAVVTAFFAMTVCNVPISLLAMFLCRNMLQYAELNNK